jgi:ATP-dependent exoDNAse (exonuclease V) beta subunit
MTVHAAKGLEAPVVFLVDGGAKPFSEQPHAALLPFVSRHPALPAACRPVAAAQAISATR